MGVLQDGKCVTTGWDTAVDHPGATAEDFAAGAMRANHKGWATATEGVVKYVSPESTFSYSDYMGEFGSTVLTGAGSVLGIIATYTGGRMLYDWYYEEQPKEGEKKQGNADKKADKKKDPKKKKEEEE